MRFLRVFAVSLCSFLLSCHGVAIAEELSQNSNFFHFYKGQDQYGHPVYLQQPGRIQSVTNLQATTVEVPASVKIARAQSKGKHNKARKMGSSKKSKNKRNRQTQSKNQCQLLTTEQHKLEKQLRQKQEAADYDKLKQKLKSLRWHKLQHC